MAGFAEKGSIATQLADVKIRNRSKRPKLNEQGEHLVELATTLKLGLDDATMKEWAAHFIHSLASRGLIDDYISSYTWKELPDDLTFGFNSLSWLIPKDAKGNDVVEGMFVAYGSNIFDTTGKSFSKQFLYYENASRYANSVNRRSVGTSKLDTKDEVLALWERVTLGDLPTIHFGPNRGVDYLLRLTGALLGDEYVQDKAYFTDDPLRRIDLRQLYLRVFPGSEETDISLEDMVSQFGLSPLTRHILSPAITQAQLFNALLHAGVSYGKFTTFNEFGQFLAKPVELKYSIGRYKGLTWDKVPVAFLNHLSKQEHLYLYENRDLLHTVRTWIDRRSKSSTI